MLARRVIVCLDVRAGLVVKCVQFAALRDVGDPVALAAHYEAEGADEITFLDITASVEGRATMLDIARRTAGRLFIPLTIGGGIATADDVGDALRAGADKVAVNSAAVARPALVTEVATRFGAQCLVASIDAARTNGRWMVRTHGGRTPTSLDAIEWARECAERGAGEILLTSIDRDGARNGYDIELTSAVRDAVSVPVIASGGAGNPSHCCAAVTEANADAVLVAGIVHDGVCRVGEIKSAMRRAGIPTREVAP
jgi:cyclase